MPWRTTDGRDHMNTWYSDQMQNECSKFGGEGSKGFQMLGAGPGWQECPTSASGCCSEALTCTGMWPEPCMGVRKAGPHDSVIDQLLTQCLPISVSFLFSA